MITPQQLERLKKNGKAMVAGNKIYVQCLRCKKMVQVNKFIFGSAHFCLTPEDWVKLLKEK